MRHSACLCAVITMLVMPLHLDACVYDSSIDELVFEETVPVCFVAVPQTPVTIDQRMMVTAMNEITLSLQKLDQATLVNLSGFGRCGPRTDKPEIRISIRDTPVGMAINTPGYSRAEVNVHLPYRTGVNVKGAGNKSNGAIRPMPPGYYESTATHEILHLFGMQHDSRVFGQSLEKIVANNPALKILKDPSNPSRLRPEDPSSIMNTLSRDMLDRYKLTRQESPPPGKILREADVQCINGAITEMRARQRPPARVEQPLPARTGQKASK